MDDSPSFFKFIVVPAAHLRKLSVPSAFTKQNAGIFPQGRDHVYLRAPGGLYHKVKLRKSGSRVSFTRGFKEFADSYSIDLGHLLIFYYKGDSRFKVLIYDGNSSCQIDYFADEEADDVSSQQDFIHHTISDKGCVKDSKAYENAQGMYSANPNFIVAMNNSYVKYEGRLWVPLEHANKYLKDAKEATLQVGAKHKGRAWTVSVSSRNGAVRFGAGWLQFVSANCLEVNDVCKFELIRPRTHVYRVFIFRHDS